MGEMDMIRDNNEKDRVIGEESKKNKEDRYRKRLKMIDREIEEMKMIEDNNEKDRLIIKNFKELGEVGAELIVTENIM